MKRLIPGADGKYLGLTVDHAIGRGVMKGLDSIDDTLSKFVEGQPNAITMTKGIAEKCFKKYAGQVPLVLKLTSFGVYHYEEDIQLADVEEAIEMGADAVSVGCIIGGDNQDMQVRQLAQISKVAHRWGMPLISHIYPRGNQIPQEEQFSVENVIYAARIAAELGVDLVKTNYTGDAESFAKVIESVPTKVAIAGGTKCNNVEEFITQTCEVIASGAVGVTYGRFVFQYRNPVALIKVLSKIVHEGISAEKAKSLLSELENAN